MTFLIVALQCRSPRPNVHYYFNYLNILKLLDFSSQASSYSSRERYLICTIEASVMHQEIYTIIMAYTRPFPVVLFFILATDFQLTHSLLKSHITLLVSIQKRIIKRLQQVNSASNSYQLLYMQIFFSFVFYLFF